MARRRGTRKGAEEGDEEGPRERGTINGAEEGAEEGRGREGEKRRLSGERGSVFKILTRKLKDVEWRES